MNAPVGSKSSSQPRIAPTPLIAIGLYLGYLAVFFATWIVTDAYYPTIGASLESTRLHYALPTLLGSAFLVVAVTALGWWRIVLFDREKSGPAWAWIGAIAMFLLAVGGFSTMNPENLTAPLVFWSVAGAIGVGIGEEIATRGTMVAGLRSRFSEGKVWLYSTLLFSTLHAPNVLFGMPLAGMAAQLVFTFIVGSMLYATRRLSGTLLLPIFLHGFWDSSVFLPRATGSDGFGPALLLYPIAIVCAIAVVRRNKGLRVG